VRSSSFAALRERLLAGGVAPRHVERIIAELEAHLQDLETEIRSHGAAATDAHTQARARLGSDDALTASILARPELCSWARRRPSLAFAVLPIVGFASTFVGAILVLVALVNLAHLWFGATLAHSAVLQICARLITVGALWLLPVLIASVCVRLAAQRRCPVLWPLIGMVLIALVGAATNFEARWSTGSAHSQLRAGIGIGVSTQNATLWRALVTFCVALAQYAWYARARASRMLS
jgi:hypothetical protein